MTVFVPSQGALCEEVIYRATKLANLGTAVSAVALTLSSIHTMREVEDCQSCNVLPPELLSGYVTGGLHTALEELGGTIAHHGEVLREMAGGVD